MQRVLIMGATSAIAEAVARRLARRGAHLYLAARNQRRLEQLSKDLQIRGAASVETAGFDACDIDGHEPLIARAFSSLGSVDLALIAHGVLSDQSLCERDAGAALHALQVNALGTISVLTHLANRLEAQEHGTIAAISSVAGDRGRASNYVYGTAKAALSTFLQGLRGRLHAHGVSVLTIKPGLVDTPMTVSFEKGWLWAEPDTVAVGILRAVDKRQDQVYLPPRWRLIMWFIRAVPEPIFKRLPL